MKKRILATLLIVCTIPITASAMKIYVNLNITGAANLTLEVELGDSIDNVKEKIENEKGIAAESQILYYKGRMLVNGRTLADYNIQKESTINLTKEHFNLAPGGTYYFDLSGLNIPGEVYSHLQDTTLHYMPFTYAGTIVAYQLGGDCATTEEIAQAFSYEHSVFIADNSVTTTSWDELNSKGLIYHGNLTTFSGVKYYIHAPSVGSSAEYLFTGPGLPRNNEWDAILDKNEGCIADGHSSNCIAWGQDTAVADSRQHMARQGYGNTRGINSAISYYKHFVYRPILEVATPLNVVL